MRLAAILEKIKDIISTEIVDRKVFDKDVAHVLSLDETKLSKLKAKDKIPYEELALFAAKRKISINWLLFDQEPKMLEEETEKYARVKYFSRITAGAGGGTLNEHTLSEFIEIPSSMLLYVKPQSVEAINVCGDSMSPTIDDGTIIFLDKSKPFIQGGVYVVSTVDGCLVKRVYMEKGYVKLCSDNKAYPDVLLFDEEVRVEGLVVGAGKL